jgi:hypothetical protein
MLRYVELGGELVGSARKNGSNLQVGTLSTVLAPFSRITAAISATHDASVLPPVFGFIGFC